MSTIVIDLSILSTPSRTRGIGRYAADLAAGLVKIPKPESIHLVGVEQLHWFKSALLSDDLARLARASSHSSREHSHASWAYRNRLRLSAAVRSADADLVHTPHPEATPLGRLGCPRVTTAHDLIVLKMSEHYSSYKEGFRPGRLLLDRRRFGSADHIIAVSEATANDLMELLDVPARKISVVHNGVDLRRFQTRSAQPSEQPRPTQYPYVLYVGAADWRKNPERMFEGLDRARRQDGSRELQLVWAGRLTEREELTLSQLARNHGVEQAVDFRGYVSDEELAELYREAVASVFVSRAEGFGYPVVEAMASGCPVITSNLSSMLEIAGDSAWLVDPEDPDAIAEAMATLTRDSSERKRLVALGLLRCQRFSVERMSRETLSVYRNVMSSDGSRGA